MEYIIDLFVAFFKWLGALTIVLFVVALASLNWHVALIIGVIIWLKLSEDRPGSWL